MQTRTRVVLLSSAAFFLRFAALGAFAPYIALWLAHGGHSTATVGGLYSLYRLCSFGAPVLIGAIADAHQCHQYLFAVLAVGNAIAVYCLTFYPHSAIWQGAGLLVVALTDASSLLDAIVVRCLAWAGAASMAPRCRAFGALAWCAVAPLYGSIEWQYGVATLYRCYGPLLMLALPW